MGVVRIAREVMSGHMEQNPGLRYLARAFQSKFFRRISTRKFSGFAVPSGGKNPSQSRTAFS
jgi:hypothetical protein